MLPPLFEMDDYASCIDNKHIFCKLEAQLYGKDNDSPIWRSIKESFENEKLMDRSILHRGFCIPRQDAKDLESVKSFSEMLIDKEIGPMNNLTSEVNVLVCFDNDFSMTSYDQLVILIIMIYSGLILFATLYSLTKTKVVGVSRLVSMFSLYHNWRKRTTPIDNADYEKLKSMQGIRFYCLLLVLMAHTKLSYGMVYLANPSFLEQVASKPLLSYVNILDVFIVQPYFMISSWLLTIQIIYVSRNHEEFNIKQVGTIILNRYFRLAVSLGVVIALFNTSMARYVGGPLNIENALLHEEACKNNWLKTILFINNFQFVIDACNPIAWYLAADFQMYVFNTFTFYIVIKYKLNAFRTFSILMAIASVLYGIIIFVYDMDIIFKPSIRNMEYRILSRSILFLITYQSTISVFGCCSVGVILGLIYLRNKDKTVKIDNITTFSWSAIFLGLPLLVILISRQEYSGVSAALLGPLVKPLYVLGIGIGILGMSFGIGGFLKKICELRFVTIMGNFNYCIYICHLPICFMRPNDILLPIEVGYLKMIEDYLKVIVKSVTIGIIMTLAVEEPGISLQKLMLPQIERNISEKKLRKHEK